MDQRAATPDVLMLSDCPHVGADSIGGKALGLRELLTAGLPVPPGFVVTTSAYRRAVTTSGLLNEIDEQLAGAGTPAGDAVASRAITALFDGLLLDGAAASAVDAAYAALGDEPLVAVRSSATAEDTAAASFAGQQETYLSLRGAEVVRRHVIRCWASLFTPHAIAYRRRFAVPAEGLAMGVVVQLMVPASAAGVMMTLEPVTGDRSRIYIEASYGLGEGVVRGDVDVDRFWVLKSTLELDRQEIATKRSAHRLNATSGEVEVGPIPSDAAELSCLTQIEALAVAALGQRVEEAFGRPMDIEWAIAPNAEGTQGLSLLQARPETVWSSRPEPAAEDSLDPVWWDPLHSEAAPHQFFSRSNIAEAIPGVQSPLSWSLWTSVIEGAGHRTFHRVGVLTAREAAAESAVDRYFRPFYGRGALLVQFLAQVGDRMPGTTGEAVVQSILGSVPEELRFAPTRRRYPFIAARLPVAFATTPHRARRLARDVDRWYPEALAAIDALSLSESRRALAHARDRFEAAMDMQVLALFAVVQPLFDALTRVADKVHAADIGALSGTGGPEMDIVADLWRCAHGGLQIDAVIRRHGFHGPAEGMLDSHVWREDPEPLKRLLKLYESRPDPRPAHPNDQLRTAQRAAVACFPRWQRPAVTALLRLAARNILLRGVCKRAFLQCFDVCRATARHLGSLLAQQDVLADPDDVFMLTLEELQAPQAADVKDLIERRRHRHSRYQSIELPGAWKGTPKPLTPEEVSRAFDDGAVVKGVGVSQGVVEGTVRVVHDPSFADVGHDEILVAPFTDPSWSSVLFISSALVVDIGGALSHAAVVAREMRIPCVVGTGDGTRRLHTGDRVRVDGTSGQVVVLARAGVQMGRSDELADDALLDDAKP